MMKWEKHGMIYKVDNKNPFLVTHAANPLAVHLKDDVFRIFYSGRNADNKSSVSFVDIDIITKRVVYDSKIPLATYGETDSYYAHGISIGNLFSSVQVKNMILFMGWQIPKGQHWRGDIGRLRLIDPLGQNISAKVDDSVYMGIHEEDPISLSYPFVIYHKGVYKMWYGSTLSWTSENGEMIHVIKYATSRDGENWSREGVAVPYSVGIAQAFSRPSVIIDDHTYHMWFSYRSGTGEKYRIGYAVSDNGVSWKIDLDNVGIDVSEKGWDSEMICYPFVFDHKGTRYMIYNGNGHGKEGFGLASMVL